MLDADTLIPALEAIREAEVEYRRSVAAWLRCHGRDPSTEDIDGFILVFPRKDDFPDEGTAWVQRALSTGDEALIRRVACAHQMLSAAWRPDLHECMTRVVATLIEARGERDVIAIE